MIARLCAMLHVPQLLGWDVVNFALAIDGKRNAVLEDDLLEVQTDGIAQLEAACGEHFGRSRLQPRVDSGSDYGALFMMLQCSYIFERLQDFDGAKMRSAGQ